MSGPTYAQQQAIQAQLNTPGIWVAILCAIARETGLVTPDAAVDA